MRFGGARFGEACSAPNDCVAGFGCVTFGPPPGVCRRLCRLGLGTECSAGTYCQTFTGRPYDWGFCV